ncbi:hypothetical protein HK405_007575 [Cladochytrium tenue]|nr:hypothetical protein HK405_007575 [Cladochytrium tenue]
MRGAVAAYLAAAAGVKFTKWLFVNTSFSRKPDRRRAAVCRARAHFAVGTLVLVLAVVGSQDVTTAMYTVKGCVCGARTAEPFGHWHARGRRLHGRVLPAPALGGDFKATFELDLVGHHDSSVNTTLASDANRLGVDSTNSHDTHVTGIMAANATSDPSLVLDGAFKPTFLFAGAAPGGVRVHDGLRRDSFVETDVMATALYLAAADGADLINLSLPWYPEGAIDQAAYPLLTLSVSSLFCRPVPN